MRLVLRRRRSKAQRELFGERGFLEMFLDISLVSDSLLVILHREGKREVRLRWHVAGGGIHLSLSKRLMKML
jgi:hypothetical protein